MARLLLLLPLLGLASCARYEGPREVYWKNRAGDRADLRGPAGEPVYTIPEQERRGRARLPLIEDDPRLFQSAGVDRPGNIGR